MVVTSYIDCKHFYSITSNENYHITMSCLQLELGRTSAGSGISGTFIFWPENISYFAEMRLRRFQTICLLLEWFPVRLLLWSYYVIIIWPLFDDCRNLKNWVVTMRKLKNLNTINIAWIDSILATLLFSLSESDIVLRPLILPGFGPRTTIIPEITFLYFLVPFWFN